MDEVQRLSAFLNATANRDLTGYADKFMRKLMRKVQGQDATASVSRSVTTDLESYELIITDTIVTRVFAPSGFADHHDD